VFIPPATLLPVPDAWQSGGATVSGAQFETSDDYLFAT